MLIAPVIPRNLRHVLESGSRRPAALPTEAVTPENVNSPERGLQQALAAITDVQPSYRPTAPVLNRKGRRLQQILGAGGAAVGLLGALAGSPELATLGGGAAAGAAGELAEMQRDYQLRVKGYQDALKELSDEEYQTRREGAKAGFELARDRYNETLDRAKEDREHGRALEMEGVRHRNDLDEIDAREQADLNSKKDFEMFERGLPPTYDDVTQRITANASATRADKYSPGGGSTKAAPAIRDLQSLYGTFRDLTFKLSGQGDLPNYNDQQRYHTTISQIASEAARVGLEPGMLMSMLESLRTGVGPDGQPFTEDDFRAVIEGR